MINAVGAKDLASDLLEAMKSFRIWNLLALQDIRQRYRRSVLGPFWMTLSSIISIGALALVYTRIFNVPTNEYLPFLSFGFILWGFIASVLIESCGVFIAAEAIIKQINLPFGVYVMRMIWRNLIMLAHNAVVLIMVVIYTDVKITSALWLFPVGLLLVTATGIFVGYLFGALCARFRDIGQVISSLVQVVFYITPVIWAPALLKGHEELLIYNPFFHYLEILRAPILGATVQYNSLLICFLMTVFFGLLSMLFMFKFKKRIAYWL